MRVETSVDCTFELVDPDGEVEFFVVRGEKADLDLLTVLDLRSSPVVGKLIAFVFCRGVSVTMSSVFRASSDGTPA